jgi:hypothetical protein
MEISYQEGVLWKVTDIDGKGEGVIAKTDIPPGTLVVEDKPLFIVPSHVHTEDSNTVSYLYLTLNFVNKHIHFFSLTYLWMKLFLT